MLLWGARFALAVSILLYLIALALVGGANATGLDAGGEAAFIMAIAATFGIIFFSILCIVTQIVVLIRKRKGAVHD